MSATDYLEDAILNHFFRNVATSSPSSVLLGLFTTFIDEDDLAAAVEVSGGSYARKAITFGAPDQGVIENTNVIEYEDMPACVVRAGAVFTGAGTMLAKNNFSASRNVLVGATFRVPVGDIIITVR